MKADDFDLDALLKMRHSPLRNYVVPGLTSWLIGAPSDKGCIRMFENSRVQLEHVTPHSHRFDFQCWVLRGWVKNYIWSEASEWSQDADRYESRLLTYGGAPGKYDFKNHLRGKWQFNMVEYTEGQCYSMGYRDIHHIVFSRDARVLFFEGPKITDVTKILLPCPYDGSALETFKVEPWMFQKEQP